MLQVRRGIGRAGTSFLTQGETTVSSRHTGPPFIPVGRIALCIFKRHRHAVPPDNARMSPLRVPHLRRSVIGTVLAFRRAITSRDVFSYRVLRLEAALVLEHPLDALRACGRSRLSVEEAAHEPGNRDQPEDSENG